jgi:hypothetical protein
VTVEYAINQLRSALAADVASQLIFERRPSGLWAAIARDAERLVEAPPPPRPPTPLQLPAARPVTDVVSSFLRKERNAEHP